jgi:hypothetical protein
LREDDIKEDMDLAVSLDWSADVWSFFAWHVLL